VSRRDTSRPVAGQSRLWLVRHGATDWSASGRHTGRTDIALTDAGRDQARALARRLAGHDFALVLTSPLQRARETCRIAGLEQVARVEADLREWDYGDYEGRTTEEIRTHDPGWTIWSGQVPGGETIAQVAARARRVVDEAAVIDGDVALFAHGHILRVLATCWLGVSPDDGRFLALDTASLSILGHEHETRVIGSWNEDATLVNASLSR
jgi:broad specificity phosphatase PhoE